MDFRGLCVRWADFEVYTENDILDPNYEMELWVPIVKQ